MEHLEEGAIHAWLDGELSADSGRELERHAAECADCAAAVAEARGLIAASSRVLTALDGVPAGVIPEKAPADDLSVQRARRNAQRGASARRRPWWRHPGLAAAAAVAFVAVGSLAVLRRDLPVGVTSVAADVESPLAGAPAPAMPTLDSIDSPAGQLARRQALPATEPKTMGASQDAVAKERVAPLKGVRPAAESASVAVGTARADASTPAGERKAVTAVPTGNLAMRADTMLSVRLPAEEGRQAGAATAVSVAPGGPSRSRVTEGARDQSVKAAPPTTPAPAAGPVPERLASRSEMLDQRRTALPLAGCYAIRFVAVGGGPMVIAPPHLPTHIALDSTLVTGVNDELYEARDISPAGERVAGVYRWRPTGRSTFNLVVVRDNTTETFPAMVGGDPTRDAGPSLAMPAGAPVRLAATVEACR
jgi:hypothetical protein